MTSTARAIKRDWKQPQLFNHLYKVKIIPLVIYGLGGVHTYMHTYTHTYIRTLKVISRNQARAWFKNINPAWLKFRVRQPCLSFFISFPFSPRSISLSSPPKSFLSCFIVLNTTCHNCLVALNKVHYHSIFMFDASGTIALKYLSIIIVICDVWFGHNSISFTNRQYLFILIRR